MGVWTLRRYYILKNEQGLMFTWHRIVCVTWRGKSRRPFVKAMYTYLYSSGFCLLSAYLLHLAFKENHVAAVSSTDETDGNGFEEFGIQQLLLFIKL